jgi:hypothetical protein
MVDARNRAVQLLREENRVELATKKVLREKLERRIKNLVGAIEFDSGDVAELRSAIAERSLEKVKLSKRISDLECVPDELEFDASSVEGFLSAAKDMIDRLAKSSSEPMNVSVQEHLESLISFVLVTPNPEGRGFSIEVHGDLAVLVSGKPSFKKDFHKNRGGTGTRTPTTLMNQQTGSVAIVEFFKRSFPHYPVDNRSDIERLLEGRTKPTTAEAVVRELKKKGIVYSIQNAHKKMAERPLTFVHVRRSGFMLRSVWEGLAQKYFLKSEDILELTTEACVKSDQPLRPDEIIKYFHSSGYEIFGDANPSLRNVLTSNNHMFHAHGRNNARWSLRVQPEGSSGA